ncbi:MAG: autotransporter domain-containing protein [Xanthomonadaceae bacterium]|nr:autotransporter domain-containing protein [Xanthomonadaceae bacterium]
MNRSYRVVFNRSLGVWQAVSELAAKRSKPGQSTMSDCSVLAGSFRGSERTFCATFLVGLLAVLAGVAPARAATVTWSDSASTTDWFTAGNWIRSPNGSPVAGDSIYIGTNTSGAATSGTVVIGSGNAQGSGLWLGYAAGTTGVLTVQQGASLDLAGSLTLGTSGTGSLNIVGGNVSASNVFSVGSRSGAADSGTGHLEITDGGTLDTTSVNGYTVIGDRAGAAQSTVLIDGQGSEWNTSHGVIIGGSGAGSGALTVQNGGLLNLRPSNTMGLGLADAVGATGSLVIDGPGSKVIASPGLTVGIEGTAFLSISNGAILESSSQLWDYDYIGYQSTISGVRAEGHVVVDGQGSSWISYSGIWVGFAGIGTLAISNGATVTSIYDGHIGYSIVTGSSIAAHGEVLITGPGSIWTARTLDMAQFYGADGILTVADGGIFRTTGPDGIRSVGNGGQGTINIGAAQGESATAPGTLDTSIVDLGAQGTLVFNHNSSSHVFTPRIGSVAAGSGTIRQLAGTTILAGDSSAFEGATSVAGGTLLVDGTLGDSASSVAVASGATLGGSGTIGGDVTIAGGGILAPGGGSGEVGTLTLNGNLALGSTSILNYHFGEADTVGGLLNDLTVVNGDLTLDGTLNINVSSGGSFDPGIYRVFSYNGMLTDNVLDIGTMPAGSFSVETAIVGQVNLVNATGTTLNFWDGDAGPKGDDVINGGDGTWRVSAGDDNWTEVSGASNGPYQNGSFAIFSGAAGIVTVDNGGDAAVVSGGMQFAVSDYLIQGDAITLADGSNFIRVGDGTQPGTDYVATIASELTGSGGIDKADAGVLVLTGANTYTGGTTISSGTLQLGNGGASGGIAGDVLNDGIFAFNRSDTFAFDGAISGTGVVNQIGSGTTILTSGNNTYGGATNLVSGTLRAGAAGVFSPNSAVTVATGATLDLDGLNQTVAGLSHAGLVDMGSGMAPGTVLTVNGAYVADGGTITMNTVLNEGGANSRSDRLVAGTTRLGSAPVRIVVDGSGGMGAQTVGNGIELVEVLNQEASAAGVFALGNRVAAGAYEYGLFHNGLGTDSADGNWYLRSSLRSEVVAETAIPALASRFGLAMLGTYFNRNGDARIAQCADDAENAKSGSHIEAQPASGQCDALQWGRVFGETGRFGHGTTNGRLGHDGPAYRFRFVGFQAGTDIYSTTRDSAGLYIGAGRLHATIRGLNGGDAGKVEMDSYAVGGYWTRRDPGGWYTDIVLQGVWYQNIDAAAFGVERTSTRGSGVVASGEAGYTFAFGSSYAFVPQAQLIYQRTHIKGASDAFGLIDFDTTDEIYGRLGGRLTKDGATSGGSLLTTWADVNVWHQFGDDATTSFASLQGANPTELAASLGGTWGQIGLGLSGQVTRNLNLFGGIDYNFGLGQSGDSVGGRVGIKVFW